MQSLPGKLKTLKIIIQNQLLLEIKWDARWATSSSSLIDVCVDEMDKAHSSPHSVTCSSQATYLPQIHSSMSSMFRSPKSLLERFFDPNQSDLPPSLHGPLVLWWTTWQLDLIGGWWVVVLVHFMKRNWWKVKLTVFYRYELWQT